METEAYTLCDATIFYVFLSSILWPLFLDFNGQDYQDMKKYLKFDSNISVFTRMLLLIRNFYFIWPIFYWYIYFVVGLVYYGLTFQK
jgi:hypothetical protein